MIEIRHDPAIKMLMGSLRVCYVRLPKRISYQEGCLYAYMVVLCKYVHNGVFVLDSILEVKLFEDGGPQTK